MLYIFEMANNHQGSVAHAKRIIDEFGALAKEKNIKAAIKLQFRQLDTFIHDDFKDSDLKFVKRFRSTRLSKEQFREIVEHTRQSGLIPMATPFDNESLHWFEDLKVPVVKVASCSIDDWVLFEELSNINKRIIISTAGASEKTLKKVYNLFKSKGRDFSFMHCIGEYPTPIENSNLSRIKKLQDMFPDIEIGISTHESPEQKSMCSHAVAMGCTIVEKHVGVRTEKIELNLYSNTPSQMRDVIEEIQLVQSAILGDSKVQKESLSKLKRGVYLNKDLRSGMVISKEDLYYCMPKQDNQFDASHYNFLLGKKMNTDIKRDSPLLKSQIQTKNDKTIGLIKAKTKLFLENSKIALFGDEKVEISCHYGIDKFFETGALIIDKINREYCKKLIVMFPKQEHPTHRHIKKEESFELLHGECVLILNGKKIQLKKGKPVLIPRGVEHSFATSEGCVIEEISTTHYVGDSVYEDPAINTLKTSDRKIKINLRD